MKIGGLNVFRSSTGRTGKHISDELPTQNGPIQGDALSSLLFNFAL
jgi:hypothetical protein